jgi:hypothetical protein
MTRTIPWPTWAAACLVLALAGPASAAESRSLMLDYDNYHVYGLQQLHADISLANQINGLNLGVDQLWALTEIAYRADDLRERYRLALDPVFTDMQDSSTELRRCLLEEGTASESMISGVERATRDFQSERYGFHGELLELEKEVERVLDENQIRLMEGARPCVRPPDELSPVRVGQSSGASTRLMSQLETMRELNDIQFERRKERFVDKAATLREDRFVAGDEGEEAAFRDTLSDALDTVYEMDDLNWSVDGTTAGDRVAKLMKLKPERPEGTRARKEGQIGRVAEVILAPGAADVLAAILERRQAEVEGTR